MFIARITQLNRTVFFNVNFGFECLEQSFVCAWSCIDASNLHSKTSFEKNCFSAWASTLNMGLINKVDMVCLSPVGYGVFADVSSVSPSSEQTASNLQLTKINYYNCFEKTEVQLDEYFECFANL